MLPVLAYSVEQKYMPDFYVRDEFIRPYFVNHLEEYFKKVNSGQVECRWRTYREHVEKPLSRDMERIYMDAVERNYNK